MSGKGLTMQSDRSKSFDHAFRCLEVEEQPFPYAGLVKLVQAAVAEPGLGMVVELIGDSLVFTAHTAEWSADKVREQLFEPAPDALRSLNHLAFAVRYLRQLGQPFGIQWGCGEVWSWNTQCFTIEQSTEEVGLVRIEIGMQRQNLDISDRFKNLFQVAKKEMLETLDDHCFLAPSRIVFRHRGEGFDPLGSYHSSAPNVTVSLMKLRGGIEGEFLESPFSETWTSGALPSHSIRFRYNRNLYRPGNGPVDGFVMLRVGVVNPEFFHHGLGPSYWACWFYRIHDGALLDAGVFCDNQYTEIRNNTNVSVDLAVPCDPHGVGPDGLRYERTSEDKKVLERACSKARSFVRGYHPWEPFDVNTNYSHRLKVNLLSLPFWIVPPLGLAVWGMLHKWMLPGDAEELEDNLNEQYRRLRHDLLDRGQPHAKDSKGIFSRVERAYYAAADLRDTIFRR